MQNRSSDQMSPAELKSNIDTAILLYKQKKPQEAYAALNQLINYLTLDADIALYTGLAIFDGVIPGVNINSTGGFAKNLLVAAMDYQQKSKRLTVEEKQKILRISTQTGKVTKALTIMKIMQCWSSINKYEKNKEYGKAEEIYKTFFASGTFDIEVYSRYQRLQELQFGTEHPESIDAKKIASWLQKQQSENTNELVKPVSTSKETTTRLVNEDLARAENEFSESLNDIFAKPDSSPMTNNKQKLKNAITNAKTGMSSVERKKLHEEITQLATSPKHESDANMMLGLLCASQLDRKTANNYIKKGFDTYRGHSDLDSTMLAKIAICYDETLDFNLKEYKLNEPNHQLMMRIYASTNYKSNISQLTTLLKTYPLGYLLRFERAYCHFHLGDLDSFEREFTIAIWQKFIKNGIDTVIKDTKKNDLDEMIPYYYWIHVKVFDYSEKSIQDTNPKKAIACLTKSIKLKEKYRKFLDKPDLKKNLKSSHPNVKKALESHFSEVCIKNDKMRLLTLLKPNPAPSQVTDNQKKILEKQKHDEQNAAAEKLKQENAAKQQAELDAKKIADKLAQEKAELLKREAAEQAKLKRQTAKKAAQEKAEKAAADLAKQIEAENASKKAARDALLLQKSNAKKIKKRDTIIKTSITHLISNAFKVIDEKNNIKQCIQTLENQTDTREVKKEHHERITIKKTDLTLAKTPITSTIPATPDTQAASTIVIPVKPLSTQHIENNKLQPSQHFFQQAPLFRMPVMQIKPTIQPQSHNPYMTLPYLPTIMNEKPLMLITVSEIERNVFMPMQKKLKQVAFLYGGSILDRVCGNDASRDIDAALIAPHTEIVNHLESESKNQKYTSFTTSTHRNNLSKLTINKTKIDVSGNCTIDRPFYQLFASYHCHFTIASMVSNLSGEVFYSDRALFDLLNGRITTVNHPASAYQADGTLIFHAVRYQTKMRVLSQKRKAEENADPKKVFDEPIDQLLKWEGKGRKFSDILWHISQNDLKKFHPSAHRMVSRSKTKQDYCSYILYQLRERTFEENGAENFIQLYALGIINILFGVVSVENTKWLCAFAQGIDKTKPKSLLLPAILIAVAAGEKPIQKLTDYDEIKSKLATLINQNPFFNGLFSVDKSPIYSVFALNPIKKPSLFSTATTNTTNINETHETTQPPVIKR